MSKIKSVRANPYSTTKRPRHVPLHDQIAEEQAVRPKARRDKARRSRHDADDEYVDERMSKKILVLSRAQQEEEALHDTAVSGLASSKTLAALPLKASNSRTADQSDESESEEEEEEDLRDGGEGCIEDVAVDAEDECAMRRFMPTDAPARQRLADIITEKLTEKKTEMSCALSEGGGRSVKAAKLDERLVNIYKMVRDILKKYRSGRLPKPFKVIPKLENWEEILQITEPESWSAAAMYQATRIFVSNLKANMAQRFLNTVLLPRIRDDIQEFKKLNFHLYQSMKKGLFKPNAFFKGFLLPLCADGTCTLREATIIASVLAKDSIPMLPSAAAIMEIAKMEYSGANSIFLRTLLDKKYALPYRVIDELIMHFLRFLTDERELPVLWHQTLLTFVQRYKADVSSEQREKLLELLRVHTHASITAEIRRELSGAACRDEEVGGGNCIEGAMNDVEMRSRVVRFEDDVDGGSDDDEDGSENEDME